MYRHEMVALAGVILVLVAAWWVFFALPYFAAADKVQNDIMAASGGEVVQDVQLGTDRQPTFAVWTRDDSAGVWIACQVVRPVLLRDGMAGAPFEVHDQTSGQLLASNVTVCPSP